jgi:glucan phosphoethanolaminetransferase (alkaline phosphatase superfamily)
VNPQDPLANLKPLRVGEAIGWWPPAPGWWLLVGIVIVLLAVLAYLLRRHYKRNAYRRVALARLKSLHAAYDTGRNSSDYLAQLNALLKSVALRAFPREQVAAAHGSHWRAFLNAGLPPTLQFPADFDAAAYQKSCPDIDVAQLQQAAQHWIRKHKASL